MQKKARFAEKAKAQSTGPFSWNCFTGVNLKQPEIGRLVGGMDYTSVSIARKGLRGLMKKDISLKQRVDKLVEDFSRLKI